MASTAFEVYRRLPYWGRVVAGLIAGLLMGGVFAGMALFAFLVGPHDPGERLAPVAGSLLLACAVFGLLGGLLHPLARNRVMAVLVGALCGMPLYLIVISLSGVAGEPLSPFDTRVFTFLGALIGAVAGWRLWSELQKGLADDLNRPGFSGDSVT